jgi:hypothetical protein
MRRRHRKDSHFDQLDSRMQAMLQQEYPLHDRLVRYNHPERCDKDLTNARLHELPSFLHYKGRGFRLEGYRSEARLRRKS